MSGMYPTNLLYAFALPDRLDVVKVGKTEEGLARRLQDANSFHPFGVRFLAAWMFPDAQSVRAAEKRVKAKLHVYRSEWFSVAVSNAVEEISAAVNARPYFGPAELSRYCAQLKLYDNLSGTKTTYNGMSLKLRIWVHQRKGGGSCREVKLSRNPWRRPPLGATSGTKFLNLASAAYAPDPFLPTGVFELPPMPADPDYLINNSRIRNFYDELRQRHAFPVEAHLRSGWTPLTFDSVSQILTADGFARHAAFGEPLPGEHPKQ